MESTDLALDFDLTRRDVAKLLKIDERTVKRLEGRKLPKPLRLSAYTVRHSRSAIARALARLTQDQPESVPA